ncbi:MAG: MFS transporter [archaeon]
MNLFKKDELKLLFPFYLCEVIMTLFSLTEVFYAFYFLNIGFSLIQISLFLTASNISKLIFEVPTGVIADVFGRKRSVQIAYFLLFVLNLAVFFTNNFYLIILLFFLIGFSLTLISGAKEGLILSNLKYYRKTDLEKEFYIKFSSLMNLGAIGAGIIGAILVKLFGLKIIWIISSLSFLLPFIIMFFVKEYTSNKKINSTGNILTHAKVSFKYIIKNQNLKLLFICVFLFGIWEAFGLSHLIWQSYLKEMVPTDAIYGIIFAISCSIGVIAPFLSRVRNKIIKENKFISLLIALISIVIFFALFAKNYIVGGLVFILVYLFIDIFTPIERHFFQKHIPIKIKSTILSAKSLILSLAYLIATPLAAFIAQNIGLKYVIGLSGLILIPVIIIYYKLK